jgi:hypothetical protein
MRKLLLVTAATCALLATQASADKLSDSFSEVEGTWCYLRHDKDITIYTRLDPTTKKPCSKTGNIDWISIDNVATLRGSEHTCIAREGGDYRLIRYKIGPRMMFKFEYRCSGEGHKWVNHTSLIVDAHGNLVVGIEK